MVKGNMFGICIGFNVVLVMVMIGCFVLIVLRVILMVLWEYGVNVMVIIVFLF